MTETTDFSPFKDRFGLLLQISQALNSTLNLDEVLNRIVVETVKATGAERGFVLLSQPISEESQERQAIYALRTMEDQSFNAADYQFTRMVIDWVFDGHEPILISDARADVRFSHTECAKRLDVCSIMCVPIMIKNKLMGCIYVDSHTFISFTQTDLEFLMAIAVHAAIAIDNARLFDETQSKLNSLKLLHEIATDLTATLDLERVLAVCLKRAQDMLGAEAASILTLEGDELVFQTALGEKAQEIKPFRIPRGHGLAGWVVEHAQSVIVNDTRSDPRFYTQADATTGFITQCLLAAPLIVNNRPIGVIEVFNKPQGFSQGDLDLLSTIAPSAAIAIDNARLYQAAVDRGRMEKELQMARDVQVSLLPLGMPLLSGWEFAARWQPAREVSGDYYDFIPLSNERLGIVIGDVTDKGMPAALFMAFTRSVVRASVDQTLTAAEGIRRANYLICTDSNFGFFITLFFAVIDPASSTITYVNAGHNPPLLYQAGEKLLRRLAPTGFPLGIEKNAAYDQVTINLMADDFITFYTDGITEAMNEQNMQFGLERLERIILDLRAAPAQQILEAVLNAVQNFSGSTPPSDDKTIVITKRLNQK